MSSPTFKTWKRMIRDEQPNEVSDERLVKLVESGLWDIMVDTPDYRGLAIQLQLGADVVMIPLTPTTFGEVIKPPFADEGGWDLIADGPGDELLDLTKIVQLPMLRDKETVITFGEAVLRSTSDPATNWGQRAAFRLRDAGNAGNISEEVFPVNTYVVCGKTQWRHRRSGHCYAWCVIRCADGFFFWFAGRAYSISRRLASK